MRLANPLKNKVKHEKLDPKYIMQGIKEKWNIKDV